MYRIFTTTKEDGIMCIWDNWGRFCFVLLGHLVPVPFCPFHRKEIEMNLNITKLANLEGNNSEEFLNKINSKLIMDVKKSNIVENAEWIDMVEFTIPYIEKALIKQIKQIITEEEIIKIELIKKVTVESVKHLSKNVNLVDHFEDNGDVIPKKILNAYKEETFMTYENRFLFTLIRLIEDFIFLREKDLNSDFKGKNFHKATYDAEAKIKNEKVRVSVDYSSEISVGAKKTAGTAERIKELRKSIKMLKNTELYQILSTKRVIPVKAPLKMTNVLLKNVNFQYAVKLWNYLSDQMEMKDKSEKLTKEYEEKGVIKSLVDEDIYLMHLIFKNKENQERKKGSKKDAIEDKSMVKELTDAMLERIIELNPDLTDKELKQLIADKFIQMKTRKVISLKPVEDRFKDRIERYMNQVREVRLK